MKTFSAFETNKVIFDLVDKYTQGTQDVRGSYSSLLFH